MLSNIFFSVLGDRLGGRVHRKHSSWIQLDEVGVVPILFFSSFGGRHHTGGSDVHRKVIGGQINTNGSRKWADCQRGIHQGLRQMTYSFRLPGASVLNEMNQLPMKAAIAIHARTHQPCGSSAFQTHSISDTFTLVKAVAIADSYFHGNRPSLATSINLRMTHSWFHYELLI